MSNVEVSGVWTAGTETVFTSVDGSLLQQRAEVFELTRVQFEMILQVFANRSSGHRDILGLGQGQTLGTSIAEGWDWPSQVWPEARPWIQLPRLLSRCVAW
jgi:hypothetical protein